MYFSENEQSVVEVFYNNLSKIKSESLLTLIWDTGTAQAVFDTCFDDFDDNNENDEYTSFVFKILKVEGNPPIEVTEKRYFVVNYHNFPKTIFLNNEKLN